MKIKIAFLSSYLPKKGPVKVLLEKLRYFDYDKFEVFLFTFKNEGMDSYLSEFESLPIKIKTINGGHRFNILQKAKLLQQELNNNNIKLVHSHCMPSLFISLFLKDTYRFNTVHIYPGIQLVKKKGALVGKLINFANKWALKKIEQPICCSKSIADEFLSKDNLKFDYVQNGVSEVQFPLLDRSSLCSRLGLDGNFRYLISFGRFSKEKNFSFMIDAFNELNTKNFRLIILGDGPMYEELKTKESADVILPGFKSNVYEYLYVADYYLSSSITEGLPMSVLEALSMGKPTLLSDIEAHKEILFKPGSGQLYKADNKKDFKNKFDLLLHEDYEQMSSQAKYLFKTYFSAPIMAKKYQDRYLRFSKIKKNSYE